MKGLDLKYFRVMAAVEGISLLILLFIAMPVKRILGDASLVRDVGSLHGVLFLIYFYTWATLCVDRRWPKRVFCLGMIASSVPFGTFWFDRHYLRGK